MKKIICMLLFIQSGFMMAQTETLVTPNGKKVTIYPSAPGTADNGLTITSGNIQLGGSLVKPSVLTTTASFTLAIKGLQTGAKSDEVVTMDTNGVLRKITNNSWDINGNAGTTAGTNFIGTTDDQDLVFKRFNVEVGRISATNISFGARSFMYNTTGKNNIVIGLNAMTANTVGIANVGIGNGVLGYNTAGNFNTSVGSGSMNSNTIGGNNTALGVEALRANINGSQNVALGDRALYAIESANQNTSVGSNSLYSLTSGEMNTVLGSFAGSGYGFGVYNEVEDREEKPDLTNMSQSVLIGYGASPLGNNDTNEVVIGYNATGRGSNTVQIGNNKITEIGGAVNWSIGSDFRLKKDIASSPYGLNFISKLRPVNYKMKTGTTDLQSGFIAQEVEAAAKSIGYEFNGIVKPKDNSDFYHLRYTEFVVPLVKAVQEQQTQIETLQKELNDLKAVVQKLIDTK